MLLFLAGALNNYVQPEHAGFCPSRLDTDACSALLLRDCEELSVAAIAFGRQNGSGMDARCRMILGFTCSNMYITLGVSESFTKTDWSMMAITYVVNHPFSWTIFHSDCFHRIRILHRFGTDTYFPPSIILKFLEATIQPQISVYSSHAWV
ncbi:hypothetical protein KCU61_g436, partial [Aureobasidium melanogenum]